MERIQPDEKKTKPETRDLLSTLNADRYETSVDFSAVASIVLQKARNVGDHMMQHQESSRQQA